MKPVIKSMAGRSFKDVELFLGNGFVRDAILEELPFKSGHTRDHDNWNISSIEMDNKAEAALLWSRITDDEIAVNAIAISDRARKAGLDIELLKQGIMKWAELKTSKVSLVLLETKAERLINTLKSCGFIYEAMSWSAQTDGINSVKFCKKLVYGIVSQSKILTFLNGLFSSWDYETRVGSDSLFYRSKAIYQNPFLFPSWHKISRQGPKLIVTPPARPLESIELETLLFPLMVRGNNEKPLLVTIDKKRAPAMIELPQPQHRDDNLFARDDSRTRQLSGNLVYAFPTGFQEIRQGLPALFYVNSVGAVGEARISSWSFEDPGTLCKALYSDEKFDLEHVREHAGLSGPRAGKVLVLRYEFYKVFRRPVQLDQMKAHDKDFNPQRQRSISWDFFQAISRTGNN
ncbi:MAG: hypothetical protein ACLQT6_16090 [Desulfomonilaceae bacterium]